MAWLSVFSVFLLASIGTPIAYADGSAGRVDCLYSSSAVMRPDGYAMRIEDIPVEYCTHIIYDSIELESNTLIIMPSNPEYDLPDGWDKILNLRQANPKLKLLMSLKSALLSTQIVTATQRAEYIDTLVSFMTDYSFDGISIFWFGYWTSAGSEEGTIYKLIEELRARFVASGHPTWEAHVKVIIDQKDIDYARMCKVADSVTLLGVLNHVNHPDQTNVPGPLVSHIGEGGELRNASIKHSLQQWLNGGCPPSKIVLGYVFMGTTFVLADPTKNELGAPIAGRGEHCPVTRNRGACAYFELCEKIAQPGWTIRWDDAGVSPYAFHGDEWIGYENVASIEQKASFARAQGLAGVTGMDLARDDYMGRCGERFPLTKALWKGFQSQNLL